MFAAGVPPTDICSNIIGVITWLSKSKGLLSDFN
jgi:hypothetical protein